MTDNLPLPISGRLSVHLCVKALSACQNLYSRELMFVYVCHHYCCYWCCCAAVCHCVEQWLSYCRRRSCCRDTTPSRIAVLCWRMSNAPFPLLLADFPDISSTCVLVDFSYSSVSVLIAFLCNNLKFWCRVVTWPGLRSVSECTLHLYVIMWIVVM